MKTILIQLDTDPLPSSFDRVVAVDAGAEEIFSYGGVTPENVEPLVHGAIFTRGPQDLHNTAIFVGGSNVSAGEAVCEQVKRTFFGPMSVSVLMDSNGSNTTASAAVVAAKRHLNLAGCSALVLGATGPVGHRVAQLLAASGAEVRLGSRSLERAEQLEREIATHNPEARLTAHATGTPDELAAACEGVELIVAAGAPGVELLGAEARGQLAGLKVAIDLNAVPPLGLGGVAVIDKAVDRAGVICYGAIGVGGTKMKVHKAALRRLFEANDLVLETEAVFGIAEGLE